MTSNHPYAAYEGTPIWRALDEALRDLEGNQDVKLTTVRKYVVGYFAQAVSPIEREVPGAGDLVRETEALEMVERITDPVMRNLVQVAVAAVRLRVSRRVSEGEIEWRRRLPAGGFDMMFFVQVVEAALQDKSLIRALLDGRSIGQAASGSLEDRPGAT